MQVGVRGADDGCRLGRYALGRVVVMITSHGLGGHAGPSG